MAIGTITIIDRYGSADLKNFICSFDGDDNYPTGGTAIADIQAALRTAIDTAQAAASDTINRGPESVTITNIIPGDCGVYVPLLISSKLKVRDGSSSMAEVPNATDLSSQSFVITFVTK